MSANYREIGGPGGLLARRAEFDGNSMSAKVTPEGDYAVYSYSTEIARVSNGEVSIPEKHYSPTTGRHQNLCREWL